MTTELEEQFFKVFGIEPKKQGYCDWQSDCPYSDIKCGDDCPYWKYENELKYPEITGCKLLEMICILGTAIRHFKIPPKLKLEQLKYHILRNCINEQGGIYTRIQQLFKEEEC